MDWRHLSAASILFTSSVLPMTSGVANAQVYAAPRVYPLDDQSVVVRSASQFHAFELFNNSQQDILYLHIYTDSNPDYVAVYGGIRKLSPGYAWKVNLGRECTYNVMAEYEDGSQVAYEGIDTCDYRGIQLQ